MNSNRVTQEQIDSLLDNAETQEHAFWGKELVVSYRLQSGFTVTGRGACVDPANFDLAIGRKVARNDAANQLWQLEGYRLQLGFETPSQSFPPINSPAFEHDPEWVSRLTENPAALNPPQEGDR